MLARQDNDAVHLEAVQALGTVATMDSYYTHKTITSTRLEYKPHACGKHVCMLGPVLDSMHQHACTLACDQATVLCTFCIYYPLSHLQV